MNSSLSVNMDLLSLKPTDGAEGSPEISCPNEQQTGPECQVPDYQKHLEHLQYVLKKQAEERNDSSFSRTCLFCRKHFTHRTLLFEHLTQDHNFFLGSLDNIVFADELLDAVSQKLENLQCIYCEKTFKDWNVLKEHMRKKFHKKINPLNKKYDIFYVEYYKTKMYYPPSKMNRSSTPICLESDDDDDDDEDAYMECQDADTVRDQECICLLCPETLPNFERTLLHMKDVHNFDFIGLKRLHRLGFYKQIKLCNYYRSQVRINSCPFCQEVFPSNADLLIHMTSSGHVRQLPDMRLWHRTLYYTVEQENDNFLCFLGDEYDDNTSLDQPVVLPEDIRTSWDPFLLEYLQEEGMAP